MTTTILVTGATGNVGRPLVDQLLAAGHRVRALTRDPARAGLPAAAEVVAGNLSDPDGLKAAFDGVDAAHLITFGDDYAPLTTGPRIAELLRSGGVRRVGVLKGDPEPSPLEQALGVAGLRPALLAPVEFMSNTFEWAQAVRGDGVVRDGFAGMPSAMVHDDDIAAVAAVALTTDDLAGRELWLTGPEALTPPEQVRVVGEVLGRELRFEELTTDEVVARWRAQGYGDDDIGFFLAMRTDPPEAGRTPQPTVAAVLGRPALTLREFVASHRDAYLKNS